MIVDHYSPETSYSRLKINPLKRKKASVVNLTKKSPGWNPRKIIEAEVELGKLSKAFKGRVADVENFIPGKIEIGDHGQSSQSVFL